MDRVLAAPRFHDAALHPFRLPRKAEANYYDEWSNSMRFRYNVLVACTLAWGAIALTSAPVHAALTPYAVPIIQCGTATQTSIDIKITGGTQVLDGGGNIVLAGGAPAGVTLQFEELSFYNQYGWVSSDAPGICAISLSGQPSFTGNAGGNWSLDAGETGTIAIGVLLSDQTGVSFIGVSSTNDCMFAPLACGKSYVFRVFAHAGGHFGRSDFSDNLVCSTQPCPSRGCTLTQGYYKNHPDAWSGGLTVGGHAYSHQDLLDILGTQAGKSAVDLGCTHTELNCKPHKGCTTVTVGNWQGADGLITLAHQLVTAELNYAGAATGNGVVCPEAASAISSAEALVSSAGGLIPPLGCGYLDPGSVSSLVSQLDLYNNGGIADCGAHCQGTVVDAANGSGVNTAKAPTAKTWGKIKVLYR